MKAIPWKNLLPVLVALAVFYALSLIYFSPVLEGKQLVQGDLRNWQGMAQEIQEHRALTGEEPLWTGSMFSGMPAYQVSLKWPRTALSFIDDAFHGFLPRPASFLFLYLLGMYVLMRCLRVDPWVSIVGAVAFGFSSYFFAILEAGHNSKANAIGYMPMVFGAVYLLYRGSKWLGAALLALFMGLEVMMNHVQITYYLGFVIALFLLAELVRVVREKEIASFVQRSGLAAVAIVLALLCNIGMLWTTYEYTPYSTRGKSELTIKPDGTPATDIRTTGLDRDYVTQWSYGKQESFTLLIPNAKGGASGSMVQSQADFNKFTDPGFRKALLNEYQSGSYVNSYWGDQSFTSGPVYVGAISILLLLLMLFSVEGKGRWWLLGSIPFLLIMLHIGNAPVPAGGGVAYAFGMPASLAAGLLLIIYLAVGLWAMRDVLTYALFGSLLLTLILSWGHNSMPLTDFFLDHVPGYSKFRAVTIILVIVELAVPVLGVLYVQRIIEQKGWNKEQLRRFLIPAGALLALLLLFAIAPSNFFEFISDAERAKYEARIDTGEATEAAVVDLVEGVKAYRKDVFTADVWRSFAFVLFAAALIYLHVRMKLPKAVTALVLGGLVVADQFTIDKRYVNNDKDKGRYLAWEDDKAHALPFKPNAADMAILQSEWSPTSEAFHKSTMERLKKERANERGTDKMIGKDEELVTRFGSLRRTSDYRVISLSDPFSDARTSYFHKSLGGYHGAKMKRYQELIEFQLGKSLMNVVGLLRSGTSQQAVDSLLGREGVLNMLNARYIVYSPDRAPILNSNALGSAWFVEEVRFVKNGDEEITALGTVDPARTALVDERHRADLDATKASADPSASVTLDSYATDKQEYTVRSANGGVVVFSSIWYGPDWQATIDGNAVPHARADYVLRAMSVPAGEHKVAFTLASKPYNTSKPIMLAGSIVVLLLVIGALYKEWRTGAMQA
jgi:hypothetical protein